MCRPLPDGPGRPDGHISTRQVLGVLSKMVAPNPSKTADVHRGTSHFEGYSEIPLFGNP